jgi:hypothetical protein
MSLRLGQFDDFRSGRTGHEDAADDEVGPFQSGNQIVFVAEPYFI